MVASFPYLDDSSCLSTAHFILFPNIIKVIKGFIKSPESYIYSPNEKTLKFFRYEEKKMATISHMMFQSNGRRMQYEITVA